MSNLIPGNHKMDTIKSAKGSNKCIIRQNMLSNFIVMVSAIPMRQISTECCIEHHKIQSVLCTTSIWGFREFEKKYVNVNIL